MLKPVTCNMKMRAAGNEEADVILVREGDVVKSIVCYSEDLYVGTKLAI